MKKMRFILIVPLLLVVVTSFAAIFWKEPDEGAYIPSTEALHKPANAVYYWRTVFNLSDAEQDFLKRNDIGRMYVRMFDVTDAEGTAVPNATIKFGQKVPGGVEIVPTVFITVEAVRNVNDESIGDLADRIVERVRRICLWNGISDWHELQLDCDWTGQTRDRFFQLCRGVKRKLPDDKILSSTVRLHQLREEAPPVDCGVLMVYNTDDFQDPFATNSILNDTTVETYLRQKMDFDLPLDIALPIYQWNLIFGKDGRFRRIAPDYCCEDDEESRFESVPYATLQRTKSLLDRYLHLEKGHYTTILYHLDEKNIFNYSDEQFKSLYNN